jgi:hypothetical protein
LLAAREPNSGRREACARCGTASARGQPAASSRCHRWPETAIALRVDELLPRSKVSCSNTHTQAPMSLANVGICAHHLALFALAALSMRPLPAKSTLATDNQSKNNCTSTDARYSSAVFVFCKCCAESGLEVLIVIKTPADKCAPMYFLNTLANFIQRE